MNFLTTYLTAIASQGALHALRVRLFAHFQKLPMSYFDKTWLGDTKAGAPRMWKQSTPCSRQAW